MSREANFMQGWQQKFIDERGGNDGQNFDAFVRASHEAHQGVNPARRGYSEIRTVRAVVIGAAVFETLCQDVQTDNPFTNYFIAPYELSGARELPKPFEEVVFQYHTSFKKRSQQEPPQTPSSKATSFAFYEGAQTEILDEYNQQRIATGDFANAPREVVERYLNKARDIDYQMMGVLEDNVAASLDTIIALGVALCQAKHSVCTPQEHSNFFADNIDVITTLASVTRGQRKGPNPALPYDYGYKILQGDEAMIHQQYMRASKKEDGGYRAQWLHPVLKEGNKTHPGHCPASDYNPLHPKTAKDLEGVEALLESNGFDRLLIDNRITAAQLVFNRLLPIAARTVYEDSTWQERVLKAER